ncbi:hypothetical protein GCM10009554_31890 [Kribbella koreensis]|uniref:Uncharacterized protein n=2 Tax=Kribbella TaxID=182639 RepID=A0ABP6YF14_9ACTN
MTPVSAANFEPVTVGSYETMIRPSGWVLQAVPGMDASLLKVAVMALADNVETGAGAAEAWVASSPAAARPTEPSTAVIRANFTVSLLVG